MYLCFTEVSNYNALPFNYTTNIRLINISVTSIALSAINHLSILNNLQDQNKLNKGIISRYCTKFPWSKQNVSWLVQVLSNAEYTVNCCRYIVIDVQNPNKLKNEIVHMTAKCPQSRKCVMKTCASVIMVNGVKLE